MEYFLHKDGQNQGPYNEATLRTMLAQGQIQPSDLIYNDQMPNWETMESVFPQIPSPVAPTPTTPVPVASAPVAVAPVAVAPTPKREESKSQAIDAKTNQTGLLKKAGVAAAALTVIGISVWFFVSKGKAPSPSEKIILDAIRKTISKPEGDLSHEDYAKVKTLELNSKGISDIGIITQLKQLEALQLADNTVSDLSPLADLKALKSLDISGNQLVDLSPISSLYRIEELRIGGNSISDLKPLVKLKSLRALDAGSNKISDLQPLSDLSTLQVLNLAENQIQSLDPLASLKALRQLIILGNPELKKADATQLKTVLPKCEIQQ